MRLRHLLWLVLATVPSVAVAQEEITLDRAVEQTLAHNPTLEAARAGAREAAAGADAAYAAYFPRFSFGEAWQRGDQPVFVFSSLLSARRFAAPNFAIDALNNPNPIGFFQTTAGFEQVLFDGGRTRASVAAARIRRELADAGVAQGAADSALAATEAYCQVLSAQAARHSAEAAVDAAQEDFSRAEHRRDVGTATEADVLSLAVHLADMRQRVITAGGDEQVARATLNRLMGAPIESSYSVVEPPFTPGSVPADLQQLIAEAARSRAELQRASAEQRLADSGLAAARAGWMPQVSAQAGYELSGTRFTDRASAWIFGGALRWSFSSGGAEASQVRAAQEARKRAEAEKESARTAVEVEIVTAVRRIDSARARRELATTTVAQARESQRIIRDRYDAGLLGVTDVLRAATMVLDAEAQRRSAVVDGIVSEAMLRRAIGRAP